jgi:O-acetyl-ADP-ribose deacetylase (regulator of RNase III)
LGAVEELQDGGDVVPEPGEGVAAAAAVAVGEAELAELAEALTELHHGAAVVLQAGRLPVSSNWVIVDGIG